MTPTAKEFLASKGMRCVARTTNLEQLLKEFGNLQWNAAIEAAAESASLQKITDDVTGAIVDISINKQSILKLKK